MPMQPEKKLRLLYILDFLRERTDGSHGLTLKEILSILSEEYFIEADRRSIYDDFRALRQYGIEVGRKGRPARYYLANRIFTIAELKLLTDAVQSSKFITAEKSTELITKLQTFCSSYEKRMLSRSVHIQNR
ncbi:MAG: WYL domain-containing protein, partial [Clostridia bacterium]|nr:WYL domain-containing protein [Clostridia bacterium]